MEKIIHKSFKTKNFSVYLTEYNKKFIVEYTDKRRIDEKYKNLDILQCTNYDYLNKAEFNFNLIVNSIILLDIQYVKEYMLYMQNEYRYKKQRIL